MARKRARCPRDRAYRVLRDRLTHGDHAEQDELYARAWAFIANLRAWFILGECGEEPEDPPGDED